jgi:hypothetical protein
MALCGFPRPPLMVSQELRDLFVATLGTLGGAAGNGRRGAAKSGGVASGRRGAARSGGVASGRRAVASSGGAASGRLHTATAWRKAWLTCAAAACHTPSLPMQVSPRTVPAGGCCLLARHARATTHVLRGAICSGGLPSSDGCLSQHTYNGWGTRQEAQGRFSNSAPPPPRAWSHKSARSRGRAARLGPCMPRDTCLRTAAAPSETGCASQE